MAYDFDGLINDRLGPILTTTIFYKELNKLFSIFDKTLPKSGNVVSHVIQAAVSSNNAAYTRNDVDLSGGTQTLVTATWDKKQYQGAAEIYNIDQYNNVSGDIHADFIAEAIADEMKAMANTIFAAVMARFLADVDSSATAYSDASLSRSTYSTLASYEETTDAAITVSYMRGLINGTTLSKNVDRGDYVILLEEEVYNKFSPLAAKLHTWNVNGPPSDSTASYGYNPTGEFDGIPVHMVRGMTTGSCYMLRKQDVELVENMPMRIKNKNSERDTKLVNMYYGLTPLVKNPGFQGKMLNKD